MENKKVIAIDGYGLLFRSFYALPNLTSVGDGIPIGGIYGTLRALVDLINRYRDCRFVVCLDGGGDGERKDRYGDYKSNRPKVHPDLVCQFDILDEMLDALNITGVRVKGCEADDIIATYAKICTDKDWSMVVVSLDKDLMQLISSSVEYYNYIKKKYIKSEDVLASFGVPPEKLVEYQTLVGDKSDNIPGVKFVGSKTAANLINQYGDFKSVYNNLENIQNKRTRRLLKEGLEDAIVSHFLVRLRNNLQNIPDVSDLPYEVGSDGKKVLSFFKKYGIKKESFSSLNFKNSEALFLVKDSEADNPVDPARSKITNKGEKDSSQGSLIFN